MNKQLLYSLKVPEIGQANLQFKKHFKMHGVYIGPIVKFRKDANANTIYRIGYPDGDEEHITQKTLETLVASPPNYYTF